MKIQPMSFFLSCLAVWLLSACCRSETYYIDQEVKDFTVFPVGSWWVYVDSVSGQRDSVVLIRINSKIEDELTKGPSNRCTDGHETIALIYTYYTKSNNELEYRVIDINGDSLSLERVRLPHLLEATNSGTIGLLLTYERNYGWGSLIADTLLQDKLNVKRLKIMVNSIHETYFSGIGLAQRKVNYHNIESNHVLTSYYIN